MIIICDGKLFTVFLILFEFQFYKCDSTIFGYNDSSKVLSSPGEPLFLTPLIEKGMLSEARSKASVEPFVKNVESYAGYFTVNKNYNSNLFFWFFKAEDKNWENLPVAVWLQGGPGTSSLLGLFVENGPFKLVENELYERRYSWHKKCNIIYIDNPVGVGFSFTDYDDGYTKNQTEIGEQLYSAVKQFFILFPNLSENEFYIAGESYAGKYIPALAYAIHENNIALTQKHLTDIGDKLVFINLKGLLIGNGFVDPYNMMKYSDYLYQLGFIDMNTKKECYDNEKRIREEIEKMDWRAASESFGRFLLLLSDVTGIITFHNYINLNASHWTPQHTIFVNSDLFRRSVHIGDRLFGENKRAKEWLFEDITKSVIGLVEKLLNHYRIIFYNGQLDVICAYPFTVNFIKNMKWSSADEYATAKRYVWKVENDVAGYYKTAGNLTEVLVRAASHLVPKDQPLWAYELFNKFIYNEKW